MADTIADIDQAIANAQASVCRARASDDALGEEIATGYRDDLLERRLRVQQRDALTAAADALQRARHA